MPLDLTFAIQDIWFNMCLTYFIRPLLHALDTHTFMWMVFHFHRWCSITYGKKKKNWTTNTAHFIGDGAHYFIIYYDRAVLTADLESHQVLEGALAIQPLVSHLDGFEQYLSGLTLDNHEKVNPWFREYLEEFFQCKFSNSKTTHTQTVSDITLIQAWVNESILLLSPLSTFHPMSALYGTVLNINKLQ